MLITAEIGINHNGDVEIAKKLIDGAIYAGADLKSKKNYRKSYSQDLDKFRESPWGTTNRQKRGS